MKLTPRQKELLKSIENKNLRKEIKKEFKKKITFYHTRWKLLDEIEPIVFENGKLETDNPKIQDFLSQHPMCEKKHLESQRFVMTPKGLVPMSDEISNMIDKGEFKTWYSTSAEEVNKKFDELANKSIPNEKGNEIISDNKSQNTISFFKLLKNNMKSIDFEIIPKSKLIVNLDYLPIFIPNNSYVSIVKDSKTMFKIIFSEDMPIELFEYINKNVLKFDESANDNPKQFTLEDMRKIYVNGILDNQNLLVTPETCQITFDMHLRNVKKNLNYEN